MSIQDKFNRANVIYKITKDIDLGGETLTIPEGCTLDFQGGSFSNGTIEGQATTILNVCINSFFEVEFKGMFHSSYKNINWGTGWSNVKTDVVSIECYKITTEEDFSNAIKRWVEDTDQNGTSLYIPEGVHEVSESISLIKNKYYKVYGNSSSSIILYSGSENLFNFSGDENSWLEIFFRSIKFIGNKNANLYENKGKSYNRCTYISDCVFESWNSAFIISNGYNTKINQSRFFNCNEPIILSNANGSSITNNSFLFQMKTAIHIKNNYSKSVFNINISNNTIEGYSGNGILLSCKEMHAINISHNYFEPEITSGHIISIQKEDELESCKLSNSTFISNYGRYDSFVVINASVEFCSFISNAFSLEFKEYANIKSLILENHRFDSYYLNGLNQTIKDEIILVSSKQNLDNSGIYNAYNQLMPITITIPSIQVPAGESKVVATVNSGKLFELYNLQSSSVYNKFKLEFIDTNDGSVLYRNVSTDPVVGLLRKPIFSKRWSDNNVHDIQVEVTNTSVDAIYFNGYFTYCNKRYD